MNSDFNPIWNGKRPKGRKPKVPKDQVVELLKQGLTVPEVMNKIGLSESRIRAIKFQAGLSKPTAPKPESKRKENTEIIFGRIVDDATVTQMRIREYCKEIGIDNRCTVRQATEEERREFGIG